MFTLTIYAYCGMPVPLVEEGTRQECRKRAARRIRYHRNRMEYPVTILKRGEEWELESDPDGCCMVGDGEGILRIQEIEEPEPGECVCIDCGEPVDPETMTCEVCFAKDFPPEDTGETEPQS